MRRAALLLVACVGCQEAAATTPASQAESTPSIASSTPVAISTPIAAPTPTAAPIVTTTALVGVRSDWCIEGLVALDDETCVVLPEKHDGSLLIYLHGIVPKYAVSEHKTRVETIVKNAAERGGVALLFPRGVVGIGPKNFESWYAWPTTGQDYAKYARGMVTSWIARRDRLERATGARFRRTYLAGSSSGAYFVAALAIHGDAPFDGFGAMSGGAGWVTPELPKLAPRPLYIGYGTADASTGGIARVLGDTVRGYGWPVQIAEHPFGHGAREVYIDEALAFWRSQ